MFKNFGLVAITLAVLALAGAVFFKDVPSVNVTQDRAVGAMTGPDAFTRITTFAGFAEGGVFTVSTTSATMTLRDGDLAANKVISVAANANAVALALTLPASTTWPSLSRTGVTQTWIIDNLNTAAATTTTITAGTGVDIDGTTADDDVINGDASGRLDCWRLATGNIRCIVEEMVDAG